MRFNLIGLLIGLSFCTFGQNKFLDSISRAQYVQRFPDYFFIWPVVKQRSSSFVLGSANKTTLAYSPNIRTQVGLGFYLFEVGFQFVVAVPQPQSSLEEFGKSTSLDLQANLIGKNWGIDASLEQYRGYYIEDSKKPLPEGIPKVQRKDIETTNYGVSSFFFFDRRHFSVRASYNFYERQLKKAGSFVLMTHFNRLSIDSDSLIYTQASEKDFGASGNFNTLNFTTVALAPGYGYNYVVKNWFLAATAGIGPAFQILNYGVGVAGQSVVEVRPYLNWRIAAGYNSERIFAGVTYTYQTLTTDYENVNLTSINGSLRIAIGYRFREVGILKKRASELIKPRSR